MANPNLEIKFFIRLRMSWWDILKLRIAGPGLREAVLEELRVKLARSIPFENAS
jgi:hypothetical protein